MTLQNALDIVSEDIAFDELSVMARCNGPEWLNIDDILYNYYVVHKTEYGYYIEDSEDPIELDDEIVKYEFDPDYFLGGLVVWIDGITWTREEGNERS